MMRHSLTVVYDEIHISGFSVYMHKKMAIL